MKSTKRKYTNPVIEQIMLDNNISLILQSDAPEGPGEQGMNMNQGQNSPFFA
jgi:hypothetical protein